MFISGGIKMICALCGEPMLKNDITIDHIFPKALYKWVPACENIDTITSFICDSPLNRAKVHYDCNIQKSDSILSVQKISALYLDEVQKQVLTDFRNNYDNVVAEMWGIKKRIYKKQHKCCYICGNKIQYLTSGTLRRKSKDGARTEDNGMVICADCNKQQGIVFWVRKLLKTGYAENENGVLAITPASLRVMQIVGSKYK